MGPCGPGPMGPGPHGPNLKIFDFLDFLGLSAQYVFLFFGISDGPFWIFFVRKMLAIGLSNFHKFTEMCQTYCVLLSWFYFSLKTHFVKLSHQESVLRELCAFKTSSLPGPGHFVYLLEILHFWDFWEDDDDIDNDNDTETPDPGQPPLLGKKYLVRTSPHFDMTADK